MFSIFLHESSVSPRNRRGLMSRTGNKMDIPILYDKCVSIIIKRKMRPPAHLNSEKIKQ